MEKRSGSQQCGQGNSDITGCRIGIYPMSDDFVEIILSAIATVDASRVWSSTDALGTLYRGQQEDVMHTAKALICAAYRKDTHMTASMTFSKGCPGDVEADYLAGIKPLTQYPALENEDERCEATISFYTFGHADYMDHIYHVIDLCKAMGVYSAKSHYSTILSGTIKEVFAAYNAIMTYADENLNHYVIETVLSLNSPSKGAN
ncbi:MAG TPA: YkoF family thiamine/hydroxymethylpyrimidine-binding protein [Erysipelothrix sp.]